MYAVSVTVFVKPDFIEEFIEATLDNARQTRTEAGNLRFDVLQCTDDKARFLFYEVYRTQKDFEAHHKTMHYLRWREIVTDWMAQPRQGVKHVSVYPEDGEW